MNKKIAGYEYSTRTFTCTPTVYTAFACRVRLLRTVQLSQVTKYKYL